MDHRRRLRPTGGKKWISQKIFFGLEPSVRGATSAHTVDRQTRQNDALGRGAKPIANELNHGDGSSAVNRNQTGLSEGQFRLTTPALPVSKLVCFD